MAEEKKKNENKKTTTKKTETKPKPKTEKKTTSKKAQAKKPVTKKTSQTTKKSPEKKAPVKKKEPKAKTTKPKTETKALAKKTEEKQKVKEEEKPEEKEDEEEKYTVKKKPELSKETKEKLKTRSQIKKRTPEFLREEWFRYKRVPKNWRRPDGISSKMRRNFKYRPSKVRVGFRGPKDVRGLHASGFEEIIVYNAGDLENINPKTQAARIGGSVGTKKRMDIKKKAEELEIRVLNL